MSERVPNWDGALAVTRRLDDNWDPAVVTQPGSYLGRRYWRKSGHAGEWMTDAEAEAYDAAFAVDAPPPPEVLETGE